MGRLTGKTAIITGAAQGIGAAYATAIAQEGANVVIADVLDASEIVSKLKNSGHQALAIRTDVSDEKSCQDMARAAAEQFSGVDILVNNAALFASIQRKPFELLSGEEWDQVMAVNVRGPFNCAKAVLPYMKERGKGKIVNVSSATVFSGTPGMLHYVTSKGAIVALTRALARELGQYDIVVNSIAPGLTMSEGLLAQKDNLKKYSEVALASRALKREQVPADLTGTLLSLVSSDSDFLTGQTIVVDGGYVMH